MLNFVYFQSHMRAIHECAYAFDVSAKVDMSTTNLRIEGHGRSIELLPQYIMPRKGSLAFTPKLMRESELFHGWRPYFNRTWPAAVDKAAFKEFCFKNGVRTPKVFTSAAQVDADALLKRSRSSFGRGVRSPVQAAVTSKLNAPLPEGEYFEQFILGTVAKVWFVNTQPLAIDAMEMPAVVGDGRSSLRQLIANMKPTLGSPDWPMCEGLATYQNLELDAVVSVGRKVLVDIRYQSMLHVPANTDNNAIDRYAGTATLSELQHAGTVFLNAIPEQMRDLVLYTLDVVIDKEGLTWFLEMNCNSPVHPACYAYMFEKLIGRAPIRKTNWAECRPFNSSASRQSNSLTH
jgi:hypothetical protein